MQAAIAQERQEQRLAYLISVYGMSCKLSGESPGSTWSRLQIHVHDVILFGLRELALNTGFFAQRI